MDEVNDLPYAYQNEEIISSNMDHSHVLVKSELVQIKAKSEEEVNRRIEAFIANKRKEVDERNIKEFISPFLSDGETSCARVEAVYVHREGEKSHISLKRVENSYGPQTCLSFEEETCGSNHLRIPVDIQRAEAVEERLANMEAHMNMPNVGNDIFKRIQALENRICYLEGLSPEYFTNGIPLKKQKLEQKTDVDTERPDANFKQAESLSDINDRIRLLKQLLKRKVNDSHKNP